jgi:hypothetical protein
MIPIKRITFGSSIRFRGTEHTWLDKVHATMGKSIDMFWSPKESLFYIVDTNTDFVCCVLYSNVRYFEVETTFSNLMARDAEMPTDAPKRIKQAKEIKAS